jgi:hypothetical protein
MNILLIILGIIGLGYSLFIGSGAVLMLILHPRINDPVRLEGMNLAYGGSLAFILSVAAIGFGVYNSWRR